MWPLTTFPRIPSLVVTLQTAALFMFKQVFYRMDDLHTSTPPEHWAVLEAISVRERWTNHTKTAATAAIDLPFVPAMIQLTTNMQHINTALHRQIKTTVQESTNSDSTKPQNHALYHDIHRNNKKTALKIAVEPCRIDFVCPSMKTAS